LDSQQILDDFFDAPPRPRRLPRRRRARRMLRWVRTHVLELTLGLVLLAGWVVGHLYYYNTLVDMEYNVQEAWAQVETQWQRRYHIQQNVTRLVLAYARHERSMMEGLTRMRVREQASAEQKRAERRRNGDLERLAGKLKNLGPKELNTLFPKIQLSAEQYPNLRLSENFQQFSKAIIETEDQIATALQQYNKAVNDYTTVLMQFPGNVFGRACGFKPYDFYTPDRETIKFSPVKYEDEG
jgi:LemA protein